MSFIVRIFFSGLIAFVQSSNGKELTVLLLNTPAAYHISDGSELAHHKPLLLARAASCTGQCARQDRDIATFLFSDTSEQQAADALASALDGGGAWQLSGSDVRLVNAASDKESSPPLLMLRRGAHAEAIPRTTAEREAFDWVADFGKIDPAGGGLNPHMLEAHPPSLIAARLHLQSGKVFTYSLVEVNGKVKPIHFKPLGTDGRQVAYSQALASWVAAEIEVSGDSIEIVDESFGGGATRSMRLSPRDGVVEMAVLNLPPFQRPVPGVVQATGQPGKHFEIYYDLAKNPPPKGARPVPQVINGSADAEVDWPVLHQRAQPSRLLDKIRLGADRSPYDQTLCPMVQFP